MHAREVTAPVPLPYLPTEHAVHAEAPVAIELYEPSPQAVQLADVVAVAKLPYMPTTQMVHAVAPARLE